MTQTKTENNTLNSINKQASRVALVTGAARRIGAAIVRMLHGAGFDVVIHCHLSVDEAHALARELNAIRTDSACVCVADLVSHAAAVALVADAVRWKGGLDLLVNNASIFIKTPLPGNHDAAWDAMWRIHVKAPLWLSAAAYPALAQRQGAITNLTDIHAEKPLKDYGLYCQTKAALKLQTEMLAREYAPYVRVNAVAPGAIAWPEQDNALTRTQQAAIIAKTPLKRHGEPKWVAHAVLFLAENAFITGQTLRVDGGRSVV